MPLICAAYIPLTVYLWSTQGLVSLRALKPSNIRDYLHLAVNSLSSSVVHNGGLGRMLAYLLQSPKTPGKGPTLIQQQIVPDLLHHLLLTAIQRHHSTAINMLSKFPAFDDLSAVQVQQCYLTAMRCRHFFHMWHTGQLSELCAPLNLLSA